MRSLTVPSSAPLQRPSRAALGELFRGVTWPRVGAFFFFAAWLSFGSYPTTRAAYAADPAGVLRGWLGWTVAYGFCYGLPVLALVAIANRPPRSRWASAAAIAGSVLAGSLVYTAIIWVVYFLPGGIVPNATRLLSAVLEGVAELGIVGTAAWLLARRDRANAALRREELERVALDREIAEARVMALQAQIEPHFLFNTLANVRRLLATDRAAGREMVRQFAQYLRSTLPQLREPHASLSRELALTSAYLSVQQVRMGDRLAVTMDVPAKLAGARFPPMMLMTLVENAIKHGLAPVPAGGRISIAAEEAGTSLVVKVIDTGAGLKSTAGVGIGIANTRARLAALFGGEGRLRIGDNEAGGVTASIEIPLVIENAA